MEVDEIQKQVSKFQNPNKIENQNHLFPVGDGGGGGVGRLCGWPSSRIVRVSRASGGKDRHSKVLTSKGLRDRRIRLSVTTAIEFYDLQDRLGYDQPSKAVEWLIKAAASSIAELPSLDPSFTGADSHMTHIHHQLKQLSDEKNNNNNNNNVSLSKSSACSSTSETSKGSGLSLSRSENRMRARERARDMAAKKEKEISSFTDLLTGGINNNSNPTASTESRTHWTTTTPMDYFQMPQFHQNHHFSFLQENFAPVVTTGGGGLASGLNRGTLQSNLLSSQPHHHHHQLQRFQPASMVDGSTSTNFAFFTAPDNFPATGYGGGDGGGRHSGHYKEKSRN
ncbi:hypothetical protein L1987_06019 [Smallanthus sonchifolius]|uniref:Uncharacterized protein n=1 Tax=Smallanthus sonchifolius TaxID=185202 RepID=A0ACB9JWZ4_9ASTR|nr:hypothetical protein L1987_06019 [Smallanthus sonchifolius]